jgi:long-chain fatty acid transport protein
VRSISNPSTNMAPIGSSGGPGFGWKSINVWKLGVQWEAMAGLTLRAGINKSDNPIQARDVSFNIIAPGVITTHYTLGATYALTPTMDLTFAYAHAKENKVTGASMFNSMMPAGAPPILETIRMHQNSFGVQVGWKF